MLRKTRWILCLLLFHAVCLLAMDAHLGIRICNNEWTDYWVTTPSPEVGLSWEYFQLTLDGTYGLYTPGDPAIDHVTQTRMSLIPMLKFDLLGPFFVASGLGISHSFRREELVNGDVRSEEGIFSDFRIQGGLKIRVRPGVSLLLRGGYSLINNKNRAFAMTAGVSFLLTQPPKYKIRPYSTDSGHKSVPVETDPPPILLPMSNTTTTPQPAVSKPPVSEDRPVGISNQMLLSSLRTFSLVRTKDDIINELNTAIESALIASGYKIISWERVRTAAVQELAKDPNEKRSVGILQSDVKIMKPFDVAQLAFKPLKLHAFIESNMRYEYQSYGGNILVHSANLRLIVPATGEILWATEFNNPESTFIKCKVKLATELLNALRKKSKR